MKYEIPKTTFMGKPVAGSLERVLAGLDKDPTPEPQLTFCTALEVRDYPKLYTDRVDRILGTISNKSLRERVKQTLGSYEGRDEKLAYSSPYKLVVLNETLPKGKVLVARPRLQTAKENDSNFMLGFYVDCGLNLVSGEEGYKVNPIQADILAKDLTQVGISLTNPKLVPYRILECQVDPNSPNGLVFRLSEQGKNRSKEVLNTSDFIWNYLPSNNGLFRACLLRGGNWDADGGGYLAGSDDNGRVVVETAGEASAKNFDGV